MCGNVSQLNCSETNADIEDSWKLQLKVEDIIMAGLFSLLAVVTVTTNLLVLASSISVNQRLRCPTYLLILSLSVADLTVGLLLLPTRSIELLSYSWTRQFIWCKVTLCLNLFSLSASLLNLLAVTFDRFLAISYSLMYNTMITKQRMYVAITAVWLTAFFMILFPLCGVGIKPSEDYHPQRVCSYGDLLERKYLALFFASICTVPTMIITVAYFKIFVLARSQERRIASLQVFVDRGLAQSAVSRGDGLNRESKAAKTVAIVIGLFYLSWSPFFAIILLAIFRNEAPPYAFVSITTLMVTSNSAINPLVYGCLNQDFKITFRKIVHSCRTHILRKHKLSPPIAMAIKKSEKQTITATIPATPLETVARSNHSVFLF